MNKNICCQQHPPYLEPETGPPEDNIPTISMGTVGPVESSPPPRFSTSPSPTDPSPPQRLPRRDRSEERRRDRRDKSIERKSEFFGSDLVVIYRVRYFWRRVSYFDQ